MRCTRTRALRELEGGELELERGLERIAKAAERNPGAPAALLEEIRADFTDRLVNAWSAWQHAGSRTANWMVTGPSNFPVSRNQKRIDTEDRRYQELRALVDGAGSSSGQAAPARGGPGARPRRDRRSRARGGKRQARRSREAPGVHEGREPDHPQARGRIARRRPPRSRPT
jgi:hypothetical protein